MGAANNAEIEKLVSCGVVAKLQPDVTSQEQREMVNTSSQVQRNGKNRMVLNCSFHYKELNLNKTLLPVLECASGSTASVM